MSPTTAPRSTTSFPASGRWPSPSAAPPWKAAKKAHALTKAKGIREQVAATRLHWNATGELTAAPHYGGEHQAAVRGAKVTATITHGSVDHLRDRAMLLNGRFLLDALGIFAGDTVTMHLQADHGGYFLEPALFTDSPSLTADRFRHLLSPISPGPDDPGPQTMADRSA